MGREASNVHLTKIMKDALCIVDPLSSEDAAVVVDFHRFTDCHLEAVFNMNNRTTSRVRLRSSTTVDGKDVRLTNRVFSPNPVQRDILRYDTIVRI